MPSPWSKGCCGGRKTRSNSRPNLFLSYLSNGDESGEKDHGNEFRGSKNGGKELWGGLKLPKMAENHEMPGYPRWLPPLLRRPDPGASGCGWS